MTVCAQTLPVQWRGRRQAVSSKRIREHYREHVGPLRNDQHVHHICENGWCSEPTHLEAVTLGEHIERHRYRRLHAGFDETAKTSTFG